MAFEDFLKSYQSTFCERVLPEVEEILDAPVSAQREVLATQGLIRRGGKRFRSACFAYLVKPSATSLRIEALLELFHVALLIHDDIVDKATLRRGGQAFHIQVGSEDRAIIWGDTLFSLVMDQFLRLTSPKLAQIFSQTFVQTCVGQLQDLSLRGDAGAGDILDSYAKKTGIYGFYLPIALALELNQEPYSTDVLETVSRKCGMLYQISDDLAILDPGQDHKSAQSDFEQRQMTYVLRCLEKYLGNLYSQPRRFSDWIVWVRGHPGTKQALQDIQAQMSQLSSELEHLPVSSPVREVVNYVCRVRPISVLP